MNTSSKPDYLIVGSGLSALTFAALMAKAGRRVKVIESHEVFGGYGHTFTEGDYKFNAHLHYVAQCGEGETVNRVLKKLGLEKEVEFIKLNADGYDRVFCEGKTLNIPYTLEKLEENMSALFPEASAGIAKFIGLLKIFRKAADVYPETIHDIPKALTELPSFIGLAKYRRATLQDVFDDCKLPQILQTLVSGQLLDYLCPPRELSFFIWAALFTNYCRAAYYPKKHYSHVIDSFCNVIREHNGELINNTRVVDFILEGNRVVGVKTQAVDPKTGLCEGDLEPHYGKTVICNMDPKTAAEWIGPEKFSKDIQKRLGYDYAASSFAVYGAVKDIDLRDYGFGSWNIWHCQADHNVTFDAMYKHHDYSKPYFAMNSCTLHTDDRSNCLKENEQIFQMLSVGNYEYWKDLKLRDKRAYNQRKTEIYEQFLDIVEAQYVPKIREHISFRMLGSPTTNEHFVRAPFGGAYGVKLSPENFCASRKLSDETSLKGFHFCCAAAGYAGFNGTIFTGLKLYEKLSES